MRPGEVPEFPAGPKQCPLCEFWTTPLPNGLIPEHPMPFGDKGVCPGQSIFKPRLILRKEPESDE